MIKIICLILGGGAGSRLYPLTEKRSKPAVPIGGKYRLIDIPISNCINSGVKRMFILTQYNSASLNAHIKNAYNFDHFTRGFVDILAAGTRMARFRDFAAQVAAKPAHRLHGPLLEAVAWSSDHHRARPGFHRRVGVAKAAITGASEADAADDRDDADDLDD